MVGGSSPPGPTNLIMSYLILIVLVGLVLLMGHAALGIILGMIYSLVLNPPESHITKSIGPKLLQVGIVLLGLSINVYSALEVSSTYLPLISAFVLASFFLTIFLGRVLGVGKKQTFLLASGNAICGGTAIAIIGTTIKAKPEETSKALSIVFLLNLVAIVLFPIIGTMLGLTQEQFGSWVALAIHDTSSVVGAASIIGDKATEVAATLKLGRTLWIVPLVIFSSLYFKEKRNGLGFPMFIIFFILAIVLNSFIQIPPNIHEIITTCSKAFLLIGLFCIGTQIDREVIKAVLIKPLFLSLIIWSIIIPSSLVIILVN